MNTKTGVSRRSFLGGAAGFAGAFALSRAGLFRRARAEVAERPALLVVFLRGGYNALFASADSFRGAGTFGVNANNVLPLGGGLVVDRPTYGTLPQAALQHMASIGVRHGSSSHGQARMLDFYVNNRSAPILLASALGGDAAIRCANVGLERPDGPNRAEGGVSLQVISDMSSTISALGGSTDDSVPGRQFAGASLQAAQAMSARHFQHSPESLVSMRDGYQSAIETVSKPGQIFDFPAMAKAYGLANGATSVRTFTSKMAAAELMILAGANVVTAVDNGWDTHGDRDGARVRNQMNQRILPGLKVFLQRMMSDQARNVVTLIFGDFSRSLPGSDHQPNLTATVIGKYVKNGTTGKVAANVSLPPGTPSVPGLWAFVAKALRLPAQPFGANPHDLLV